MSVTFTRQGWVTSILITVTYTQKEGQTISQAQAAFEEECFIVQTANPDIRWVYPPEPPTGG
jgi:hypothetical protein